MLVILYTTLGLTAVIGGTVAAVTFRARRNVLAASLLIVFAGLVQIALVIAGLWAAAIAPGLL